MNTVSILTPSTYSRREFILILRDIIQSQTYPHILEWLIVDGSPTIEQDLFKQFVETNLKIPTIETKYYDTKNVENRTIGFLRNKTNEYARGDIMVCMDDDDYYCPDKVKIMVNSLKNSLCLIAGTDSVYVYEPLLNKIIQHPKFGKNHATNNTMAYKREYLKRHRYDETVKYGEESSFTNNFTEPMVQVPSMKGVLVMSHKSNTYSKKKLIYEDILMGNKTGLTLKKMIETPKIYHKFMNLFQQMYKKQKSPYDIVYICGFFSILWSPESQKLGGSEQAIVNLCENWVKMGKRVAVYGTFNQVYNQNGVDYFPSEQIAFNEIYDTIILWRACGLHQQNKLPIQCKKVYLDLHDHPQSCFDDLTRLNFKLNGILLKSKFHQQLLNHIVETTSSHHIIPNGIRLDKFVEIDDEVRQPYRMCYTSCYTRGLEHLLEFFYPKLKELEPRAELHIYYGMDLVSDEELKLKIKRLLNQPGIYEYGKQPVEVINKEKHRSTFHLYYTSTMAEIDCIAVKESLLAGCIPILSGENLFSERDGLHFNYPTNKTSSYTELAISVAKIMNDYELQELLRERYKKSKTIIGWEEVARQWLEVIKR